jgi:FkbM family methyltransferase
VKAHHPVFERFAAGTGPVPNWVGVTTRREFFTLELDCVHISAPPIDTEYFEWVDLLEAVVAASKRFTMLEVGAGYGRWIVNAAAAVRAYSQLPTSLVAVEAEPTHFEWLAAHCLDNDVTAELVCAAVVPTPGTVEFAVGNPAGWYGQAIVDETWVPESTQEVPGVTLSSLLEAHEIVDLIHMDVQGVEADVLEEARGELRRVRRIHVGTHGRRQEERLRSLFTDLGWDPLTDYRSAASARTPWGKMAFQDGVQTWLNPNMLESGLR